MCGHLLSPDNLGKSVSNWDYRQEGLSRRKPFEYEPGTPIELNAQLDANGLVLGLSKSAPLPAQLAGRASSDAPFAGQYTRTIVWHQPAAVWADDFERRPQDH
ncbi:hypothetical protein BRAO375_1750003 [Bradyrhizobium sp. ORS 375]|nr:hypothetical protein BRAO375_1750003 [Bradyrhizobium sp. ORS 375]